MNVCFKSRRRVYPVQEPASRLTYFIKYIKQIGLDELKYFPLLPKETIQFALKRLTPTQQAQYLVDYAKYTAFNDIDRHSALLENLKSLDSAEAQKHALYILLEKTNETDSFKPFTDNAKDLLDQLAIEPEEFLRNNKAQYSLYAPKVPFDCAEALNIILN